MLSRFQRRPRELYDLGNTTIAESFTLENQFRRTFLSSWMNILLPYMPAEIVLGLIQQSSITFAINLLATIPLAALGEIALEEIRLRLGDQYSGLVYMTTVYDLSRRTALLSLRLPCTSLFLFINTPNMLLIMD